jgi:TolC family type I secretion outer membrane protein
MQNITRYLKKKSVMISAGLLLMQQSLALAAPLELSLEESVRLALQNNPAVQIAGADREKSMWGIDEAKAGKYPTVSLGSSYNYNENTNDFSAKDINNNLRLNWQLYSGGRIEKQIEQARLGLTSADLNVEKTKQQLKLDTATAYYNVLQAEHMVSVNQETADNLKEHQKVVTAKYEAGIVAKSDVLRSEVELSNAEQNLIKSQNQYALAVSSLNNIMNVDANSELHLKDELQHIAYDKTLEQSIELAKTNRPDIAQADTSVRMAANNLKIAESGKAPAVSLSASTGWNDSVLPDTDNWSVGVSASWNVFDAGATNSKIKQAKTAVDKAILQSEQTADSVEQEVRQSYLGMKEAEKRLETVNVAVDKAKEDLYIAKEKYSAGVGTNLDVIDAQLALTQARTNHIQALYDYNVNQAKLDKAIGVTVN